jgi:hypothetical protein
VLVVEGAPTITTSGRSAALTSDVLLTRGVKSTE